MKAVKNNKVYTITEADKASFVAQGYDIIDDIGNVISYGKGKSVDYNTYKNLEKKCDALELENEMLKLNSMTVEQLKSYAENKEINLGDATTKDAILQKIKGE